MILSLLQQRPRLGALPSHSTLQTNDQPDLDSSWTRLLYDQCNLQQCDPQLSAVYSLCSAAHSIILVGQMILLTCVVR